MQIAGISRQGREEGEGENPSSLIPVFQYLLIFIPVMVLLTNRNICISETVVTPNCIHKTE